MLTLQIISLMDKLWLSNSMDLHLKPYKTLSTGKQSGMIEIVLNSKTVNYVSEKFGGVFEKTEYDPNAWSLEKTTLIFLHSVNVYQIQYDNKL